MKKFLFPLIAAALITSCDNKTSESTEKSTETSTEKMGTDHATMADRNAEATNKVYRALESGNFAGIDTILTDDVIDHDGGPQGQDIKGKDSVMANLTRMHNYFDGLKFEMMNHATSADGMYHYATARMTGKAKENPWGMPVGQNIDDVTIDLIKIRDGKCAEHWAFMSMHDFNEIMTTMHTGTKPPVDKK
jgi:predicted SnoaL-like aldol condensation-catalyzing enzyme